MIDIDKFRITEDYSNGTYTIHFICQMCKKAIPVMVPGRGLFKYRQGAFVQDAFPTLSAGQRELFLSGICETCYDSLFPEDEDDD